MIQLIYFCSGYVMSIVFPDNKYLKSMIGISFHILMIISSVFGLIYILTKEPIYIVISNQYYI